MTWWCNKSNTGRHPFGYLIKYIFCQIVDFQRNHRISKIVLCGNATSELEQPRQRWRKRDNNKSNRFNKQNRNSEHEADFLADLIAVIARLTLSNLIGMAMWSSLKSLDDRRFTNNDYCNSDFSEIPIQSLSFASTQSWFQRHFYTKARNTYYPNNPCSSIVVNWFLFFVCQRLWKNSINHKEKTIFLPCSDLEGTRRTLKVKKIQLLFIWQASNNFMGKVFLSLTYFLTSECSQCTRSKVSHVQLTPTMLAVVASVWT